MLSNEIINRIARVVYTTIREFDLSAPGVEPEEVPTWDELSDEERQPFFERVKFYVINPKAGDAYFHNQRVNALVEDGWKFGREFSEEKKLSPFLVPFAQLPHEMQVRERLFHAITEPMSKF